MRLLSFVALAAVCLFVSGPAKGQSLLEVGAEYTFTVKEGKLADLTLWPAKSIPFPIVKGLYVDKKRWLAFNDVNFEGNFFVADLDAENLKVDPAKKKLQFVARVVNRFEMNISFSYELEFLHFVDGANPETKSP